MEQHTCTVDAPWHSARTSVKLAMSEAPCVRANMRLTVDKCVLRAGRSHGLAAEVQVQATVDMPTAPAAAAT